MALSETSLIELVNNKIHNSKAKIGGDDGIEKRLNDGLRDLRLDLDLSSAKRKSAPFLIFQDIYEYPAPSDLDYGKTIGFNFEDVSYQGITFGKIDPNYFFNVQNPINNDIGSQQWLLNSKWSQELEENGYRYATNSEKGVHYLMVRSKLNLSSAQLVQTAEITNTLGGTWSVGDDGSGLRVDNQRFKTSSASLAFNSLGAATDVSIQNTTFTAVDLTSYDEKGVMFAWVYLPATTPASITMSWGNDSSNFWSKQITVRHNGLSFINGWNLISFDWESATETGTVDPAAIDYFKLVITNSAAVAQTGYRIDRIYAHLGKEVTLDYYTKFLVQAEDGTLKEEFTSATDTTLLGGQEVNTLIDRTAQICLEDLREKEEAAIKAKRYGDRVKKQEEKFPSEQDMESTTYHIIG